MRKRVCRNCQWHLGKESCALGDEGVGVVGGGGGLLLRTARRTNEKEWRGGGKRERDKEHPCSGVAGQKKSSSPDNTMPLLWVFIPLFREPIICSRVSHGDHLDWWCVQSNSRAPSHYTHGEGTPRRDAFPCFMQVSALIFCFVFCERRSFP